ncbi:PsbP-related protein [Pseudanabaena sp. Chao 1811]|uniref:PsbP-related protein n=1 Tax=Pseudanabaena sp. Chao 1811 TaxID=2963092 RepID=UPI0022F39AA8|nr:PsbP-related protein [Pseudanabaena sp. Chao 1811]
MKKYISLAAGLVLFAVSACTPSTPVADNATPTKSASPTATSSEKPSEKPKDSATPKASDKPTTNSEGWQDYKSAAGKFSIQLPSKPQEQSQDQKTDVGTIKLNMVIAEANDSGYFVGYADFPNKIANPADVQKGLSDSVKGSVGNLKGEIKSEKESTLGDIPCRDFEAIGKVKTTDVSMKGRFCLADNRLYQVFALGAKDKLAATDVDRFITSFKIEK